MNNDVNIEKIIISEETKHLNGKRSDDFNSTTTYSNTIGDSVLPNVKKEVPMTVSVYSIISVFTKSCQKFKFLVTEQTPSACTAYHTKTCSLQSVFMCCLGKKSKVKISSIRLILSCNTRAASRIVYVKGQQGDIYLLNKLIMHFLSGLDVEILKFCDSHYQKVIEEEDEELAITCKNESYSYYQFYKILSCEAYTLGKSITQFCEAFNSQYRNPVESSYLVPQPLLSIQSTVESTIESLFSHYNYGKKNTEKVMIYCRPAVEKYIYTKLHNNLMSIYIAKYKEEDLIIEEKKLNMKKVKPVDILKSLNVPEKFWIGDNPKPYEEAAECLVKINEFVTPAEKLNCVLNFEAILKSEVVGFWKGQEELDEECCILIEIYCIIITEAKNIRAEVGLLSDYLRDKTDDEKLSVFTMEKALSYLIR